MLTGAMFAYDCAIVLDDGTEQMLDLEVHGWAEPKRLARVKSFSLIPKYDLPLPIVAINIPTGSKPVFKSRVFGTIGVGAMDDPPLFRCYAVGYKSRSSEYLLWVLPTGDIEVGPDPRLADKMLTALKQPKVLSTQ